MKRVLSITRKELDSYFGSPMALIFVGIFLLAVLFSFFWGSGFFARGIADVRPLFLWMPLLLIFLISTLTMRQWSEEQQTGTLEVLMTMPVRIIDLVLGKFLAVLVLVCVALLLTLSLPVTAIANGPLDFGPVIGGYLAAILMASAYIAIGLFISSRTDNQIVSLLLTAIVCGLFYLVGSSTITGFVNTGTGEFLRALGTGSRFESIERGVIDLRDLLYYVTLTGIFLALNVLSLDSRRWGKGKRLADYRLNRRVLTALIVVNLIVFNVLMFRVGTVRADLTQEGQYSLSPVTRDLLANLQEPLLIRGYFSQDTHPLLAPLIPAIEDELQEYKVAAGNKLQLDFVDPLKNPALEQEANQTYGIRPSPLQVNTAGKTSVVNAYMDILIRYGDQNTTLNLLNMVENRNQNPSAPPDIQFRNLEYDLTSAIQKTVYGFQNIDAILASFAQPAQLTLYMTPKTLPDTLKNAPTVINTVVAAVNKEAGNKLNYRAIDVSDPKSGVDLNALSTKYQIDPITAGFLSPDTYYLHMLLEADGKTQVIYPSGDISDTGIRSSIENALKRVSTGFLHVIGVWTPPGQQVDQFGQPTQSLQQYTTFQTSLRQSFDVRSVDLTTGQVPTDTDALIVIGPQSMTDVERYAVDQYLMRGGSVFIAAGNYQISTDQSGGLALQPLANGLSDVLASYGITVEQKLVMDPQNLPFPVQVQRSVGGVAVSEIQSLDYAPFVDVRPTGMDPSNAIDAHLPEVALTWASPVTLDTAKLKDFKVTTLLRSTANSWTTTSTVTQPNFTTYPDTGFPVDGTRGSQVLAVAIQGSFTSYFKGRTSPFAAANAGQPTPSAPGPTPTPVVTAGEKAGFVAKSPDTARLVIVGSSEFLNDNILNLEQRLNIDTTTPNTQFVQNIADYFTEDAALSSIRAKASSSRLLKPLPDDQQTAWEVGNYVFVLAALIALGVVWQVLRRNEKPMKLVRTAQNRPGRA